MITIEADSFRYAVEQHGKVAESRAADDGCPPYDSPVRIRLGTAHGDNCMVTLRWNDFAGQVTATVSRAFDDGKLPTTSIEQIEGDAVTVRVHIADTAPIRVTRLRRRG